MNEPIRRILIIKPSALGDVVHGLPILHGLRAVHPDAHIAWMVHPAWRDLLAGHPELNQVLDFDRRHFGRAGRAWAPTRDLAGWLWRLRKERFDLVVDLQGLFRSGFFTWVTRAPLRVGFAGARECGWLFYNRRVRIGPGAVHAVDRNYRFAEPLGFAHVPPTFVLPVAEEARAAARANLAAAGLNPQAPYAVLVPGSTWASKRWPADRFARVAEHLARRHRMPSVMIGAPREQPVGQAVRDSFGNGGAPPADLIGRTRLAEAVALLADAAVVVTNDSGPMHIAAALGRPLVAIFGPTDAARTGPYRRPDTVVQVVNDRRHHFRHQDTAAIAAVPVELVCRTLDRQLAGPAVESQRR